MIQQPIRKNMTNFSKNPSRSWEKSRHLFSENPTIHPSGIYKTLLLMG